MIIRFACFSVLSCRYSVVNYTLIIWKSFSLFHIKHLVGPSTSHVQFLLFSVFTELLIHIPSKIHPFPTQSTRMAKLGWKRSLLSRSSISSGSSIFYAKYWHVPPYWHASYSLHVLRNDISKASGGLKNFSTYNSKNFHVHRFQKILLVHIICTSKLNVWSFVETRNFWMYNFNLPINLWF